MSNPRLLPPLAALLLLSAACGPSGDPGDGPPDGARLYEQRGCVTCHKAGGRGGPLGPSLRNASEYWSREQLVEYLADPASFIGNDARLNAMSRTFNQQMPPVRLPAEQLLLLADYVLGLGQDE
jgi:mono/diheme cytochrome c family protein